MTDECFDRLSLLLEQAFSEEWDPSRPIRFQIDCEESIGTLRFFVRRQNTSWNVVHEEPLEDFVSLEEVDTFVANALSHLLMKHPSWLR